MTDRADVRRRIEAGDELMRRGRPAEATCAYGEAWPLSAEALPAHERVWLLIAIALAAIRSGDFETGFDACAGAIEGFAHRGPVAGNPLFHLVAGLAALGLEERGHASDHLARALITGGPAMFAGEDPRILRGLKARLKPPAELGSWDGYTGCSRDLLDGAKGYLAELVTEKLGVAPPYGYD